ncbi:MAG: ATP-binding protein [Oscillatoriales cyanobacterium]|nr:MAG: ATP-binding protein [Oscillatoriales cyanobacterium]
MPQRFDALNPSVNQTIQLRITSDLGALDRVLNWFDTLDRPQVPRVVWIQCLSVLAEIFTNAVRHAHVDRPVSTPIELEAELTATSLTLRLWDYGDPFDLCAAVQRRAAAQPDPLEGAIEQLSGGGRGLQILDRVADRLSYDPQPDGRNLLEFVKYFEPVPLPLEPARQPGES